eukprot:3446232-Pyramimonas_sp.AAC.1
MTSSCRQHDVGFTCVSPRGWCACTPSSHSARSRLAYHSPRTALGRTGPPGIYPLPPSSPTCGIQYNVRTVRCELRYTRERADTLSPHPIGPPSGPP